MMRRIVLALLCELDEIDAAERGRWTKIIASALLQGLPPADRGKAWILAPSASAGFCREQRARPFHRGAARGPGDRAETLERLERYFASCSRATIL